MRKVRSPRVCENKIALLSRANLSRSSPTHLQSQAFRISTGLITVYAVLPRWTASYALIGVPRRSVLPYGLSSDPASRQTPLSSARASPDWVLRNLSFPRFAPYRAHIKKVGEDFSSPKIDECVTGVSVDFGFVAFSGLNYLHTTNFFFEVSSLTPENETTFARDSKNPGARCAYFKVMLGLVCPKSP